MTPQIPVSWGELIDKITILDIKAERLSSETARANVRRELERLCAVAASVEHSKLAALTLALKRVNETLWRIEDDIRGKEAKKLFDAEFVELARAVYRNNDERGRLKAEINAALNSEIVEEKQYVRY
jgi:hypothetical protein